MLKIIDTNVFANYLQREIANYETELTPVLYMYGNTTDELCGTTTIIDELEFASIDVLRNEIKEQRERSKETITNYDEEDYFDDLSPWMLGEKEEEGLIVCKEGLFEWRWDIEEYEFIGKIQRTHRQKKVSILTDFSINTSLGSFSLKKGDSFDLSNEYVSYDNDMNPIVMLVVHYSSYVPLVIPYDNDILKINYMDLVVINFVR